MTKDGSFIATESMGDFPVKNRHEICIWDTKNWTIAKRLPGAMGPIEFSPDGKMLAINIREGISLRKLDDSRERILENSTDIMMRPGPRFRSEHPFVFSPDGKYVVVARNIPTQKGVFNLSVWSTDTGKEIGMIPDIPEQVEHTGLISGMAFSPDGQILATSSWDHSVRLWDFSTRKKIATLQGHLNEVWSVAFSADGKMAASGAKDGEVKLWETRRREDSNSIPGEWLPLAFSQDSSKLAAVKSNGKNMENLVAFYNMATLESDQLFHTRGFRVRFTTSVALSADFKWMAHILEDGDIAVLDTEISESIVLKAPNRRLDSVALSPNGNELIVWGMGQPLFWWDLRAGTNVLLSIEGQKAIFSPDGHQVAVIPKDSSVQLWDVASHKLRTNIVVGSNMIFNLAFSPNGKIIATASGPDDFEHSIRLWDAASGKFLGACKGHKQAVWSMAFSADDKTLATARDDSTLKLWNIATQQELLTIRRLGSTHNGLLFSPNGRYLAGAVGPFPFIEMIQIYTAPLINEISRNKEELLK
jgi:WD40 repeat protein